jgi:hypothetical protein
MLRRYPDTLRWRQALPPLFVLSVLSLIFLSLFISLARALLIGELFVYFSVLFLAGVYSSLKQHKAYLILGLPLAMAGMHIAWGSGFLWSILTSSVQKNG